MHSINRSTTNKGFCFNILFCVHRQLYLSGEHAEIGDMSAAITSGQELHSLVDTLGDNNIPKERKVYSREQV